MFSPQSNQHTSSCLLCLAAAPQPHSSPVGITASPPHDYLEAPNLRQPSRDILHSATNDPSGSYGSGTAAREAERVYFTLHTRDGGRSRMFLLGFPCWRPRVGEMRHKLCRLAYVLFRTPILSSVCCLVYGVGCGVIFVDSTRRTLRQELERHHRRTYDLWRGYRVDYSRPAASLVCVAWDTSSSLGIVVGSFAEAVLNILSTCTR